MREFAEGAAMLGASIHMPHSISTVIPPAISKHTMEPENFKCARTCTTTCIMPVVDYVFNVLELHVRHAHVQIW